MNVFKGQSSLRLVLDTDTDLTLATAVKIKYQKPSGATGYWTAHVLSASGGTIYYDMSAGSNFDQVGAWTLWAYVTFSDGRTAPGDAVIVDVLEEGE